MSLNSAVGCVIGRFPHREEEIAECFGSDERFRALCEDYFECLKSLARWTREPGQTAAVYQEDYRELLAELEGDILNYLDRLSVNPSP